ETLQAYSFEVTQGLAPRILLELPLYQLQSGFRVVISQQSCDPAPRRQHVHLGVASISVCQNPLNCGPHVLGQYVEIRIDIQYVGHCPGADSSLEFESEGRSLERCWGHDQGLCSVARRLNVKDPHPRRAALGAITFG